MTYADLFLLLVFVGFLAWIAWEIHRAPIEEFDRSDFEADSEAAEECIAASRPAELRPHVRANTAYGKEVL